LLISALQFHPGRADIYGAPVTCQALCYVFSHNAHNNLWDICSDGDQGQDSFVGQCTTVTCAASLVMLHQGQLKVGSKLLNIIFIVSSVKLELIIVKNVYDEGHT
jgi:hypothetical protein